MSTSRVLTDDDHDIEEHVAHLNAILAKLHQDKKNDPLSGAMVKFFSEAIKLQHASLQDDFSQKDKIALKETLLSAVDFFSVPNIQTFGLLQQQLEKSKSEMVTESKVNTSTSSQRGKLKKFFGILGVLVGGIGTVFASTAAAPVAIAGIAVFLHQRRVEQQAEKERLAKGKDNKNVEEKTKERVNILASLREGLDSIQLVSQQQVPSNNEIKEGASVDSPPLAPPLDDAPPPPPLDDASPLGVFKAEAEKSALEQQLDEEMKQYAAQRGKSVIASNAFPAKKENKESLFTQIKQGEHKLKKVVVKEISIVEKLTIAEIELKKLLEKKETQIKQAEEKEKTVQELKTKVNVLTVKSEKATDFVKEAEEKLRAKKEEIKPEMILLESKKEEKDTQVLQLVAELEQAQDRLQTVAQEIARAGEDRLSLLQALEISKEKLQQAASLLQEKKASLRQHEQSIKSLEGKLEIARQEAVRCKEDLMTKQKTHLKSCEDYLKKAEKYLGMVSSDLEKNKRILIREDNANSKDNIDKQIKLKQDAVEDLMSKVRVSKDRKFIRDPSNENREARSDSKKISQMSQGGDWDENDADDESFDKREIQLNIENFKKLLKK